MAAATTRATGPAVGAGAAVDGSCVETTVVMRALTGTALAVVTPAVSGSFPDWRWILYFAMHGGVIAAAAVLVLGCGIRPRPGAPWRAFGWTAAYAAAVAAVDIATGANFLWLRAKPPQPTLLDWLGPWPMYILAAGAIGLTGFYLLALPFREPD